MIRTTTASLRFLLDLPLLGLPLLGLPLVAPAPASAQCTGTELFCASVTIGGDAQWAPPPPVDAQVVLVPPAAPPPVVYVQPAPPPVVYVQPAPVLVQPAPVYVQPAPVYVQPAPVVTVQAGYVPPVYQRRRQGWGLHGHIGGMVSPSLAMGGATGTFRLRPNDGHFALDLGIGGYAGQDYNGLDRVEVPLTADLLLFLNPRDRLQVYGVAGVGFSFAHAEGFNDNTGGFESRDFRYFGGQLGAGLELRLNEWFAINGDVRGMLRTRIDGDPAPEFVETDAFGATTGRTTDTSGGVLFNLGATVYF